MRGHNATCGAVPCGQPWCTSARTEDRPFLPIRTYVRTSSRQIRQIFKKCKMRYRIHVGYKRMSLAGKIRSASWSLFCDMMAPIFHRRSVVSFVLAIACCDAFLPTADFRAATSLPAAAVLTSSDACQNDTGTFARATYQTLFTMDEGERLRFQYDFDELVCGNASGNISTHAVILTHPIGVGIGRWYYDRLLESLEKDVNDSPTRFVFLVPDLLGSGSASAPIASDGSDVLQLPLLKVSDWANQMQDLMADYEARSESKGHPIGKWAVVANGGCSPIALEVAQSSVEGAAPFTAKVHNVVLSSPPRLSFFLESTDPEKVKKSYRTLSGVAGNLFWWYALRKDGRFIQRFSEKNLVGQAENLGDQWTKNCVAVAKLNDGRSRYLTFSFLAGSLQEGCKESLGALKNSHVQINFIRGTDRRRNRARSWFWQRRKPSAGSSGEGVRVEKKGNNNDEAERTIEQYVKENGNGGGTEFIGGRISLAHEDPDGYAAALSLHLSK